MYKNEKKERKTLKKDIEKYLDTKICAGGLYGLTIHDPGFVRGLLRVIKRYQK